MKTFPDVPRLVFGKNIIKPGGIFILEHSGNYDFSDSPLFSDKRVYGSVNFSMFENSFEG
jgi:hypothetical protein